MGTGFDVGWIPSRRTFPSPSPPLPGMELKTFPQKPPCHGRKVPCSRLDCGRRLHFDLKFTFNSSPLWLILLKTKQTSNSEADQDAIEAIEVPLLLCSFFGPQ